MGKHQLHVFLLVMLSTLVTPLVCWGAEEQPAPLARDVLALYDPTRESDPRTTRIHRFVELALNHLGYRVRYWKLGSGTPDQGIIDRLAAVVSWFDASVAMPGFATWTTHLARTDGTRPKLLAFGHPGVALEGIPEPDREVYLGRIGVQLAGPSRRVGAFARILNSDPAMVEHDAALNLSAGLYPALTAAEGARSYLRVAPGEDAREAIDLVVIASEGAYVNGAATLVFDPRLRSPLWLLDVFTLLETVLGAPVRPIPDVTTILGRRLFFATVGPEGWLWHMPAQRYGEPAVLASEVLADMLVRESPQVPASVAVVTGDLDPEFGGRDAAAGRAAAATIFKLPQIEIATAGRSYVLDWGFFGDYEPAREADRMAELRRKAETVRGGLLPSAFRSLGDAFAMQRSSIAGTPRKYHSERFDIETEIGGALRAVGALAPEGRRAGLFVWSGDAMPPAPAIAALHVPALGGGGGIVDPAGSPVADLWPFSAPVAETRQVYDALSGESAYGGAVDGMAGDFNAFVRTLEGTETPRRLKPFQLSFSAGSMIDFGPRRAVQAMLGLARDGQVHPVWPSDYVRIVQGFETAEIVALGPLQWRVGKRGALETIRFDRAADLALNLDASLGVLGARRKDETLYVALDPAAVTPLVALTPSSAPTGMISASSRTAIASSRWTISNLVQEPCGARFDAAGFGPGDIVLAAQPGRAVRIEMSASAAPDRPLYWITLTADSFGQVEAALPPGPERTVKVALSGLCRS